ncbi:MAG: CRISPR-associated ring nuclease Csm6 [Ignavibacterium sp.]|uniref:CRISPR-associated ring nuclease Csm6 n=1 Tax=Ignavibacterium sp. TaxID=2651167 RepID=UPI00404AAAE6
MSTNNILICVSGLTPQIVTETLFCLAVKEKIQIDEIYVLTTKRGRDVILGLDEHPSTPKTALSKEIKNLCRDYNIKKPKFEENDTHIIIAKEESIELSDIRSDKDNILFPNKVASFIREKTADSNNVLYCSITGGRKSMSVHLANALSLFARENDKLLHVLTKEEHEFKGFYPKNKNEIKDLELSEIPFVRLRSLLMFEDKDTDILKLNFDQIVKRTQRNLKLISDKNKFILDFERREIKYKTESIILEPLEFLFYYFFVDSKERGIQKISIYDITSNETRERFIEYFNEYYAKSRSIKDFNWYKKGFNQFDFRSKRSKINNKIKKLLNNTDLEEQFIINVDKIYGDSKYFIKADIDRFLIKKN